MELGFWWFPVTRMRTLPGGSHATCILDTGVLKGYRLQMLAAVAAPARAHPDAPCKAPAEPHSSVQYVARQKMGSTGIHGTVRCSLTPQAQSGRVTCSTCTSTW